MKFLSSWISSGSAIALLLAFFALPWVTVSCSGVSVSPTGYELASGNIPEADTVVSNDTSVDEDTDEDTTSYGILWLLLLVVALAAYGVYLRETSEDVSTWVRNIYFAASGLGLVALFVFYQQFNSDAIEAKALGVSVSYEIGIGLAVLAVLGIGSAALYFNPQEAAVSTSEQLTLPPKQSTDAPRDAP